MIYEFITGGDPITFIAESDAVAWVAVSLLAKGKAGCIREDGEGINTMTVFVKVNKLPEIFKEYSGTENIIGYIKEHKKEISDAFLSFSYGSIAQREQYDAAIAAITDPEKLKQFKALHEDTQRTFISRWVNDAWSLGEQLKEQ
jgi:hypothetical protein